VKSPCHVHVFHPSISRAGGGAALLKSPLTMRVGPRLPTASTRITMLTVCSFGVACSPKPAAASVVALAGMAFPPRLLLLILPPLPPSPPPATTRMTPHVALPRRVILPTPHAVGPWWRVTTSVFDDGATCLTTAEKALVSPPAATAHVHLHRPAPNWRSIRSQPARSHA
jgi:hypothetical protein